jgi:hypothetical protein
VICPLNKTAAMLRFDKPRVVKRRSGGADDELQDVILKAMAKKISWLEAAEIAGVTDRTMRRIRDRYQEFGYTGLFDQRCGKQSIHRVPMQTAEEVLRLYREVSPRARVRSERSFGTWQGRLPQELHLAGSRR